MPSCSTCGDLNEFQSVARWEQLVDNAAKGCEGCDLLLRATELHHVDTNSIVSFELHVDLSMFLMLYDGEMKRNAVTTLEFFTENGKPSKWPKIGPARHLSNHTRSGERTALLRSWLDECLTGHPECEMKSDAPLPTRLIRVGITDSEVRLHIPGPEERSRYATLSHKWGFVHPTVTTKSSLEAHKKRIILDDSSRLFADAINVTRKLGIPYIWIDSLCIVQDSVSDWTKEAGNMTNVYNNSTVTLFAHSSANGSQLLISDDVGQEDGCIPLPLHQTDSQQSQTREVTGKVFVRQRYKYPHQLSNSYHTTKPPKPSYLGPRGWILQEELLSPRSIHFHVEEISWTCSTFSRCECRLLPSTPQSSLYRKSPLPLLSTPVDDIDQTVDKMLYIPPKDLRPSEHQRIINLLVEWPDIVMDFSRRMLTVSSDLLPALSGLAAYTTRVCGDCYLGGVFLGDLGFGLLWFRDHAYERSATHHMTDEAFKDRRDTETETYQDRHINAPSWSWASLPSHAAISYFSRHKNLSPKHFVKYHDNSIDPLMGNAKYLIMAGAGVFGQHLSPYGWGPGLLTVLCRCVYIKVIGSWNLEDIEDEGSDTDTGKRYGGYERPQCKWVWEVVDQYGRKGGDCPLDLDLRRMQINMDFEIDDDKSPEWGRSEYISDEVVDTINGLAPARIDFNRRQEAERERADWSREESDYRESRSENDRVDIGGASQQPDEEYEYEYVTDRDARERADRSREGSAHREHRSNDDNDTGGASPLPDEDYEYEHIIDSDARERASRSSEESGHRGGRSETDGIDIRGTSHGPDNEDEDRYITSRNARERPDQSRGESTHRGSRSETYDSNFQETSRRPDNEYEDRHTTDPDARDRPTKDTSPPKYDPSAAVFVLMLAGALYWKYGVTPVALEGACLVLEPMWPEHDVYRRVGFATGAGSTKAWARDVRKRAIHIV